jgi:hypothetical protein
MDGRRMMMIQITDRTFDAPHPNPDHLVGVTYDPVQRCAFVDTPEGIKRVEIGDWITLGDDGQMYVTRSYEMAP